MSLALCVPRLLPRGAVGTVYTAKSTCSAADGLLLLNQHLTPATLFVAFGITFYFLVSSHSQLFSLTIHNMVHTFISLSLASSYI